MRTLSFNERGQKLVETDSLGLLYEFERDARGNVVRTENGRGYVVETTYDERGNRLDRARQRIGPPARPPASATTAAPTR